MIVPVATIELLFCMCGPEERKCKHCYKAFVVDSHGELDRVDCIACGNPTWPQDIIRRTKTEIKKERQNYDDAL